MNLQIHITITAILVLLVIGCRVDNSDNQEIVVSRYLLEGGISSPLREFEISHTSYYTTPEIFDLSELKGLLSTSDKVLAYNFNGYNMNSANVECTYLYDSTEICSSAVRERILTQDQIEKLILITCDSATFDGKWSGLSGVCFIPHLGFGFFRNDTLISQVNVCLICGGIRTKPFYRSDGLSEMGGWQYIQLAKELDLEVVTGSEKQSY